MTDTSTTFPACEVCGQAMMAGQRKRHHSCTPAERCVCIDKDRQAWLKANVYPVIGVQPAPVCAMHEVST